MDNHRQNHRQDHRQNQSVVKYIKLSPWERLMGLERMLLRTIAKRDQMLRIIIDLDYSTWNPQESKNHWACVDAIDRTIVRLQKQRQELMNDDMTDDEWVEYDNHSGSFEFDNDSGAFR
jgi:hypothetical protein